MQTKRNEAFTFISDVESASRIEQGVELHAAGARVRVRVIDDGLAEVRLAQENRHFEEPPFSYAVDPSFTARDVDVTVSDRDGAYRIESRHLNVLIDRNPLRLAFSTESGPPFARDSFGMAWRGHQIHVWKERRPEEVYYGLGEKAADMVRNDRFFVNWNTDEPGYQRDDDPLYKTLPFYLCLEPHADGSTTCHGVFFDNSFRSTFDFGGSARGHVSFGADGGELRYYVMAGPSMQHVLE
ncbi:MAG: alpha-glucosidase, partial [Bacteroidota bacterium]